MKIINVISTAAIPVIIFIIAIYGIKEKRKVFDDFGEGVIEGGKIVIELFPTLLGLIVAVGVLRASGVLDFIINIISPLLVLINIPVEIMPLAILRPISGSASMAIGINMLQEYGVDSLLGKIITTIMGSTETTLYIIAIYTAAVKVKKVRFVLVVALIGDVVGMLVSVVICRFLT